jgi:hypothetical protein
MSSLMPIVCVNNSYEAVRLVTYTVAAIKLSQPSVIWHIAYKVLNPSADKDSHVSNKQVLKYDGRS